MYSAIVEIFQEGPARFSPENTGSNAFPDRHWLEPQPTEVLSVVVGMFERFGASPQSIFDLEETARIDRGKCVARTYRVEGLMAMWLLGIGIVQFYDADGNMLATINLLEEAVPQQMVA